jgi:hypothetical protein
MQEMNRKSKLQNPKPEIQIFLLLFLFIQSVYSQSFEDGYYRLTTQWLGEVKSLDVVNDGVNNQLHLTNTGNFSGQFWKITALGNGYYRLTTQWLGMGKSLDVVNDGINNKLQLANTSNASGQFWKITPLQNGYYRLTTRWLGDLRSLEIVNDGASNKIQLAETGDFSGQFWKIAKVTVKQTIADTTPDRDQKFKELSFSGFKIFLNLNLAEKAETVEALEILSERLETITKLLQAKQLEKLQRVPIWIQYKTYADGAMWYHTDRGWLTANGYPASLENSIEIKNIRNFIDWQADQPMMVLHELAHAFEDLHLGDLQDKIDQAYKTAVAGGKYQSVPYIRGGKQRAYALNNKTEYFAELTESYFGTNDYYPFNREQLAEFDPQGYKLMQQAWD